MDHIVRESGPAAPPVLDFDALYAGHVSRLVRLAGLLGAHDPEDVVQESFCRLYQARDRLTRADVTAYLNRIVVNEVRSRGRRLQTARSKQHLVAVPTTAAAPSSDHRAVVEELARLPRRQREALVLRYWLDLPFAEIADVMGVRPGTAKSQVSRGLQTLSTALGEENA